MPIQTDYLSNLRPGVPGQQVNMVPSSVISRTIENADGCPFGFPVAQGAADYGAIKSTAGVTKILGVAMKDRSAVGSAALGYNGYAQRESARIMIEGVIWVTASVAVVAGDIVHVIVATGAWAKTGGVLVPNARWETSAGIGALAALRISPL